MDKTLPLLSHSCPKFATPVGYACRFLPATRPSRYLVQSCFKMEYGDEFVNVMLKVGWKDNKHQNNTHTSQRRTIDDVQI